VGQKGLLSSTTDGNGHSTTLTYDGLFMHIEMRGDARHDPAFIAEAQHFQPGTHFGSSRFVLCALSELLPLFFGQTNTVHVESLHRLLRITTKKLC